MSPNKQILIRFAVKQDIPFLIDGMNKISKIEKEKPVNRKRLVKSINSAMKNKTILIICIKENPVGFVQFLFTTKNPYGIEYGNYEKRFCWIDWFYISKEHRNEGLGKLLHKKIVERCKKERVEEIMLDVFHINLPARNFYKKVGFEEYIHIIKKKL